jgi:mannitol-1-phosphate 5-dehydrogenase
VSDKKIVIWGPGRIGRGFIARLFAKADYQIVFVHHSELKAERLRAAGRYPIVLARGGDRQREIVIDGYTAYATSEADVVAREVASADLLAVTVHPTTFPEVVRDLVPGLLRRSNERPNSPLDILLCTNVMHPTPQFRTLLEEAVPAEGRDYVQDQVGLVETLVICMAPEPPPELLARDPLTVVTDGYPELPVARDAFRGPIPQVCGLKPVTDMHAEEVRKIYTYNMTHAVLAYLGARRGYTQVVDCVRDPEIRAVAAGALDEISVALQAEFDFSPDELARWNETVLRRMENPALRDQVNRVGADPVRKLRREDRLVGPALLARKHGITPHNIAHSIATALRFRNPEDASAVRVSEAVAEKGPEAAIRQLCGLTDAESDLITLILAAYGRLVEEDEWTRRADEAYRLGFEYEQMYHGCGQCALAAILDTLDQFDEAAAAAVFEAATGLAGGLGLVGNSTCAALIGATLAFGMLYPRRRVNFDGDRENKYRTYSMAQRLQQRYLVAYGSIFCHDIHRRVLGRAFDLRDPAEREAFEAAGGHDDKCTGVVARAAQWAVEIIGEEQRKDAEGKEESRV